MTNEQILEIIQSSLSQALEKNVSIKPTDRLREDLNIQSIDMIDFFFILEKKISYPIKVARFYTYLLKVTSGNQNAACIQDIIDFVSNRSLHVEQDS